MKIGIFVPARLKSRRLPGKVLLPLGRKTILAHVLDNVKELTCKGNENVFGPILITEDIKILKEGILNGVTVLKTPHCSSGSERLFYAAKKLKFDFYINVQADEPFLGPAVLEKLIHCLDKTTMIYTLYRKAKKDEEKEPSRVKIVMGRNNEVLYFSRSPIPSGGPYLIHLGLYAFPRELALRLRGLPRSYLREKEDLEQLDWAYHGIKIRALYTNYAGFGIDTPKDYILAKKMVEKKHK